MAQPGAIVDVDFPGVQGIKRRPSVEVSSDLYHGNRPDVVIGLLTSQVAAATSPTDYLLQDWQASGLQKPSAFRTFLVTLPRSSITANIGELSQRDREAIESCLRAALIC